MERIDSWKRRRFTNKIFNRAFKGKRRTEHQLAFQPNDLVYDYQVKGAPDKFKADSDQAVRDLRNHIGNEPSIHLGIERLKGDKGEFAVSMSVVGLGGRIHIKKTGKNVPHLIKKVKKMTLSRVRRQKQKPFKRKQLRVQKQLYAS